MPYKRGDVYYVDTKPSGYPHRIARSTDSTNKRLAQDMESTLHELARAGKHEGLDALRKKEITLPELHAAKVAGSLDKLLQEKDDPVLRDVIKDFIEWTDDRAYHRMAERVLDQAPAGARLSWLTDPRNVNAVADQYRSEGLAPSTENREMVGVSVLLGRYLDEETRKSVMSSVDLRPIRRTSDIMYYSDIEINRIRKVSGGWWRLILLALSTGIRRSELLRVRRKDVDLEHSMLLVGWGKGHTARRQIPFGGECAVMLEDWLGRSDGDPDDPLFPDVSSGKLERAWQAIKGKADISKNFHGLRHTYAVNCARSGMPLPELQRRMGHEDITTTMIYAQYAPPQRSIHYQDALERMGVG